MLAHGCREFVWLSILLEEIGFKEGGPMVLNSNGTSTIKLAKNPIFYGKTKHVEVDCHITSSKKKSKPETWC